MQERQPLTGKVAIVTGAGRLRGIGRATAVALAEMGADVAVTGTGRDPAKFPDDEKEAGWRDIESTAEQVRQSGRRCLPILADVSASVDVHRVVAAVVSEFGRVDILVNNAGIYPRSSVEGISEEEWDRVIGTILVGNFLCSRSVAERYIAQRSGRIISLASGRGLEGAPDGAHYAAAKAGVIGFIRSLALEMAPYGVTANTLVPGVTDTAMPRAYHGDEYFEKLAQGIPLGRVGQPEDLVGATVFLASDAARFVTGQTVVVNGGAIRW